jgi:4-aminobutyrate aminotransferase-like enzyme
MVHLGNGKNLLSNVQQVALSRAEGSIAYDVDGNSYIDFLSMIAVNNMGHNHPKIINASIKALQEGATVNLAFQSPYYGQLARRVTQVLIFDTTLAAAIKRLKACRCSSMTDL